MSKKISIYLFFLIKCVSAFKHFGHLDLKSYHDPRFLNSDFKFSGLGLFHPNSGEHSRFSSFNDEKKNVNADEFFKKHGISEASFDDGHFGVYSGKGDAKDIKGESGYFFDIDGKVKEHLDGKKFFENEHFGNEEKTEGENTALKGHRKGHKIKGFSNSHHNDESTKSEEYYDEDHDEAENDALAKHFGFFGEKAASFDKGGFRDGKYKLGEVKHDVSFKKEDAAKKIDGSEGHFGEKKIDKVEEVFGKHQDFEGGELKKFEDSLKYNKEDPAFYF